MKLIMMILLITSLFSHVALSQQVTQEVDYRVLPVLEKIRNLEGEYYGHIKDRLDAITDQWLIPAPKANPMMINMFRIRDRERDISPNDRKTRIILPWYGEFVGKHLLSAQLVHRMTHNTELKESINKLIRELVKTQGTDGYMGPFPKSKRFDNSTNWDFWGHYHIIQALIMYYEDTGWRPALEAACKAAELICDTLMPQDIIMNDMNFAIIHGMTNLYLWTGESRYLRMAQWVVEQWDRPNSLKYISLALEGKPVVEFPAHRWESAHDWQGIAEMYLITGDEKYRKAFSHIWRDALRGDRHNTGGWTSGEGIQNNPYHQGAIETCCTVAWIAFSTDMLRLTGNSPVADELELSTWNGNLGSIHPSGDWCTYNTPMDGVRRDFIQDHPWQQRAGSPKLNCCSVNAPRGLGMIQDWAFMKESNGIVLNWYGPSTFTIPLGSEKSLVINQKTDYPNDGHINITIGLEEPLQIALKFRIPSWSDKTIVKLNGKNVQNIKSGTYLELNRTWQNGDSIELSLDMSPHFWAGERECEGKVSIYSGPILLAWDQRFNSSEREDVPALDAANLDLKPIVVMDFPRPIGVYKVKAKDNSEVVLCDFSTAGMTGTLYRSWLPVEGVEHFKATRDKPVWTAR